MPSQATTRTLKSPVSTANSSGGADTTSILQRTTAMDLIKDRPSNETSTVRSSFLQEFFGVADGKPLATTKILFKSST